MESAQALQPFARNRLQPPDETFNMTIHLIALIDLVKDRPGEAVLLLKDMGVLFFETAAAFHFSILSSALVIYRGKFMSAFRREGWDDAPASALLPSIVGLNEIKNWTCLRFPHNSPILTVLSQNPFLRATEAAFGRTRPVDDVLIAALMPPHQTEAGSHFPLVSVEYDRVRQTSEIADVCPAARQMVIEMNVVLPWFVDLGS
jgi:hypothetical protein